MEILYEPNKIVGRKVFQQRRTISIMHTKNTAALIITFFPEMPWF